MSVFTLPADHINLPTAPMQKIERNPNMSARKLFTIIIVIGVISALAVAAVMYQNGDTKHAGIVMISAGSIGLVTMIVNLVWKSYTF
ncbi:hypothetical protein EXVG_00218 [Emiliania huxleyi virus 202]|nr:hypothetical protein EXVG_00218 [Emiliania huxleyi virus 202]AHA54164.1 putative membrane protein [Emiliania huxleyi virus 18]AHA55210.1 putative membrane protein [Emiliania huxleyi virus 156]